MMMEEIAVKLYNSPSNRIKPIILCISLLKGDSIARWTSSRILSTRIVSRQGW